MGHSHVETGVCRSELWTNDAELSINTINVVAATEMVGNTQEGCFTS